MEAIETDGLTKRFGRAIAVDRLTLRVPVGSVFGFVGPNGAGKTTAMRLMLGLLRPDAGTIHLLGHDVSRHRRQALANVGALVETPSLYDHLSGRNNLDVTRRLLALPIGEIDRVLEVVDLTAAARRRVGGYSLGMKQRLALARALLGSPRLLLLDEPSNGLDPDGMIVMRDLIRALPERIDGTVFVSSHLLGEIEQVCTHVALLRGGRLAVDGEVAALMAEARRVRLTTDDAVRTLAVLACAGFDATREGAAVRLTIAADADLAAITARANQLLVEAGVAISAIVPEAQTLESLYRRHVEGGML